MAKIGKDSGIERLNYTIEEAVFASGIGRTSLYALIKLGKLSVVKIGQRTLITKDELNRLVSEGASKNA
jgi:excisionase family DNA binding protein